jgi:Ca2+-transporting ATPase
MVTLPIAEHEQVAKPDLHPFACDAADVASFLRADPSRGLNEEEVTRRRHRFGPNELQSIRPRAAWLLIANQFRSLIIILLASAAAVAFAAGSALEGFAILVALIINACVGFATEWKAGRALDALRKQTRAIARTRRNGREISLDAAELVCGDVVILNPGDLVPGDARILEASSLRADESILTGESAPVDKSARPVASDAPVAERYSMLYLGTMVASGRATAIITSTGAATEIGRIGKLISETPVQTTPLEGKLVQLGHRLVYMVLIIAAIVLLAGLLRGESFWMMMEVAISLAVAAVPESLPAVTTLTLALGVLRMARHRALVRRLTAVETLGSATVICADKTGTLTENRMRVREYRLANGKTATLNEDASISEPLIERAVRVSALCNEASFDDGENPIGDPTETALLDAARALRIDIARVRADFPIVMDKPFDAGLQRMITVHRSPDGSLVAAMKGAPAVVLKASVTYADEAGELPMDERARAHFLRENDLMASEALRVLALAEKKINRAEESEIQGGYTFLGLVGMIDPPRREVPAAVEEARNAGIRVVMLTGDQVKTALAIAKELKISDGEIAAMHANELEGADREKLAGMARRVNVFARVSPEHKLRIVESLQSAGEVVAVTGDGVNDAPALRRADIGVAMGERGTEVAKESADIVLADDNFATIIKAIEGGRAIYANIVKFVHLMFSKNLGQVLMIFIAILLGWPLPLAALQILWINLVTDVFPALALAVEPPSSGIMRQPPRSPRAELLSRPFVGLIVWQGAMIAAITLAAYRWALDVYGAGAHAQSIALLATINAQLGHLFNCRSRSRSAFEGLFRNRFIWGAVVVVIILQLMAVYLSPLAQVLGTASPVREDWIIALLSAALPVVIVEATKAIGRHRKNKITAISK